MSLHFTYVLPEPNRLCQGDVLKRTPALEALLREYFPYYCDRSDYKFFIVTTQSCDLFPRESGDVNAQYIALSPVRPLRTAVEREVTKLQYEEWEQRFHVAELSRKQKINDFMERLLNNNEADYFFLFRQTDKGLDDDHCAFLKLSIAFKVEHYKALLAAKILQLNTSFQHKLGYNVGHSFARVGTEDWIGGRCATRSEFAGIVSGLFESLGIEIVWIERHVYNGLKKFFNVNAYNDVSYENFNEIVSGLKNSNKSNKQRALSLVKDVIGDNGIPEEIAHKIAAQLNNKPDFMALIK